ncbi:hypothetical protein G6F46_008786 [Rhizopus delemar]|uniref:Uncharacterized protein n=3 Tax=Rhizopus TaxID=4842 RepID=I1CL63_RHIO9|nr:hypothetical protein RO3G_13904 [Rhizopus delemar RA 99-880]KAG1452254.1 hypothetical protein G6F55_008778 [Rhizopus delemar]KAG1539619.1 hypothetical protein G6F51_009030 [Rhizopus arrhizus]KAG1493542.1 hypothetical protein G6F54_008504 [Rhizopus delemar]KAG1508548.1 hypothetical protein G6F53_008111 [Rhizopus delemar]|eukprot:EIE89193.1 hypothetical protein RO3G_13904 [Rhizopus delemar RA 99-880]
MPATEPDPLSFLLNKLPTQHKKHGPSVNGNPSPFAAWTVRWPSICQILFELDYLHHGKIPPETTPLGVKLVKWLCNN